VLALANTAPPQTQVLETTTSAQKAHLLKPSFLKIDSSFTMKYAKPQ
jgi:hypothetical protein